MRENIFIRDRKTPVLEDYLSYAAGSSRSPCSGAPGAGRRAGAYFAKTYPDLTLELDAFVGQLQQKLVEMKIGVLRIESIDPDTGTIHLTVSEDADCSGLLHEADGRMYAQKEVHRQKFTPEISGAEA